MAHDFIYRLDIFLVVHWQKSHLKLFNRAGIEDAGCAVPSFGVNKNLEIVYSFIFFISRRLIFVSNSVERNICWVEEEELCWQCARSEQQITRQLILPSLTKPFLYLFISVLQINFIGYNEKQGDSAARWRFLSRGLRPWRSTFFFFFNISFRVKSVCPFPLRLPKIRRFYLNKEHTSNRYISFMMRIAYNDATIYLAWIGEPHDQKLPQGELFSRSNSFFVI